MPKETKNEFVDINGESFICIRGIDKLAPFLMSIVSDSDHWLFVGSNGPFTAGRVDADRALFPYQTVDKILRHADSSGALTILQINRGGEWVEWKPTEHTLYKHIYGTSVVFEQADDRLRFRWSLTTCEPYGFVRECRLENLTGEPLEIRYLDGWHQLLPPNITQQTFNDVSYLAKAYMRHEAHPNALGVYTLNAGITDRAEASESLRAACAWSLGHQNPAILLTDRQVESFRKGKPVKAETEVRGEMGACLVAGSATLTDSLSWVSVADTWMDHASIVRLQAELADPAKLRASLDEAIRSGQAALRRRIAAADGLQASADQTAGVHHFANVLFNCMRGGTFPDGYQFPSSDFAEFLKARSRPVHAAHQQWLKSLPASCKMEALRESAEALGDPQLSRLAREYLPLTFSRRHGDPSRPWNRFNIRLKNEHGEPIYAYQGNWRDIFQNWESLGQSCPLYFEQMVSVFLNASTADGYNPYRITRDGIDWEAPEPDNPWANIGYWGDHQIIYLLRLLESWNRFEPGALSQQINTKRFAYARVPYLIAGFDRLVENPRSSITFDRELHRDIMGRAKEIGGDAKMVSSSGGSVLLVSLAEKLLVPALVKLSNLVPGGGIWLNTQRPEWNDANNALAGWGLSMVTVCYLRRYLAFIDRVFQSQEIELSAPVARLLREIVEALKDAQAVQGDDAARFSLMERLGRAGEAHRNAVYANDLSGAETASPKTLIEAALPFLDATIRSAKREDGLFESYNILHIKGQSASVQNLSLMLEGQVAALSSGALTADEAATLLQALRESDLYREDQHSYILYPDRKLAPFLERNSFDGPPPLTDRSLFAQDASGKWHFQADIRNASDVAQRLAAIGADAASQQAVLDLWEELFRHNEFTGRSGTMFMFEGLGSIYWHMVAKLLLAVQECWQEFRDPRLAAFYQDIRDGLGFRKRPEEYGAFPTDPYSHTPKHRGAQQPGMTGQVKEEILTRWGELGITVKDGCLKFEPNLLERSEYHAQAHRFEYVDVLGQDQEWEMPPNSLGFTFCQVPVCYVLADAAGIEVEGADGSKSNSLSMEESRAIFARANTVRRVTVFVPHE